MKSREKLELGEKKTNKLPRGGAERRNPKKTIKCRGKVETFIGSVKGIEGKKRINTGERSRQKKAVSIHKGGRPERNQLRKGGCIHQDNRGLRNKKERSGGGTEDDPKKHHLQKKLWFKKKKNETTVKNWTTSSPWGERCPKARGREGTRNQEGEK